MNKGRQDREKRLSLWSVAVGVSLALVVGFLAVARAAGVWSVGEVWSQVLAACMGAIVVAVITMLLMRGQRSSEEEKEKSIAIYESKVEVYSRFVARMYKLLADEEVSCQDFLGLRTEIFSSLIFYLDSEHLRQLLGEVEQIRDFRDSEAMVGIFARIANILQDDLADRPYTPDDRERVMVSLWQRFSEVSGRGGCNV